jgi:hypothetical protein
MFLKKKPKQQNNNGRSLIENEQEWQSPLNNIFLDINNYLGRNFTKRARENKGS